MTPLIRDALAAARPWGLPLLVVAPLLLAPVGRSAELPTLAMAIAGAVLLFRHGRTLAWSDAGRTFSLLFLCVWLPMAFSVPDSAHPGKSLSTVLTFPRLYLAGLFILHVAREAPLRPRILALAGLILGFWVVDGLVQAGRGTDLFGFAYPAGRLNALYGETSLDFGVALAVLSPLLLEAVRRRFHWGVTLLALGLVGALVLLAGSRGGWVSYGLVVLVMAWLLLRDQGRRLWLILPGMALVLAAAVGLSLHFKPDAAQRMSGTLAGLHWNYQALNTASSQRVRIWEVSLAMVGEHPVNGVGVRGFRYSYPHYVPAGDDLVVNGTGPFYAHQLLVEVTSETGLIGLAGLLAFYVLLIRHFRALDAPARRQSLPYYLAAWAWLFPINAHTAFYSSQWSLQLWWLLALAVIAQPAGAAPKARSDASSTPSAQARPSR